MIAADRNVPTENHTLKLLCGTAKNPTAIRNQMGTTRNAEMATISSQRSNRPSVSVNDRFAAPSGLLGRTVVKRV